MVEFEENDSFAWRELDDIMFSRGTLGRCAAFCV